MQLGLKPLARLLKPHAINSIHLMIHTAQMCCTKYNNTLKWGRPIQYSTASTTINMLICKYVLYKTYYRFLSIRKFRFTFFRYMYIRTLMSFIHSCLNLIELLLLKLSCYSEKNPNFIRVAYSQHHWLEKDSVIWWWSKFIPRLLCFKIAGMEINSAMQCQFWRERKA